MTHLVSEADPEVLVIHCEGPQEPVLWTPCLMWKEVKCWLEKWMSDLLLLRVDLHQVAANPKAVLVGVVPWSNLCKAFNLSERVLQDEFFDQKHLPQL